jgi:tetratricopeptide (TPR) repeat protein
MRSRVQARRRRASWPIILGVPLGLALLAALAGVWAYQTDPRVQYRVLEFWGQVRDVVAPHPAVLPTPVPAAGVPTLVLPPTPTLEPTATPRATSAPAVLSTPVVEPSDLPPTLTPTPFPSQVTLTGFKYEPQLFNNCGPASLAINLSYWGWTGNQKDVAAAVKPNQYDRNVSPRELYEYLLTQGFDAYIRVNGDLDTLKRFIAAGYPVLVEKGYTCEKGERCSGWFGHYSVFTGYDDAGGYFITQDTFRGPDLKLSYEYTLENWRAFNYLYLIVFPAEAARDAEVAALLGEAADLNRNYRDALARAQAEALTLTGQDAAFAWFNVGTNLHYLQDYAGAAAAYDQARQTGLPYRMLWYQFGSYRAYYQMARYQDVIDIATFAIEGAIGEPGLEEAYFWRGQAEEALGQREQAIEDYRTALVRHPGYQNALDALAALGVSP